MRRWGTGADDLQTASPGLGPDGHQDEEIDGLAATRQIKAAFPNARIVIVTGYDDIRLREAAPAAGACAYVDKENLIELRGILVHDG